MIAWKTSSGCAYSAVKMMKLTLTLRKTKFFQRYVDVIVSTVRADTKKLLVAVSSLHPNLKLALETTDDKNSLAFLDMSINVKPEGTNFCTWYQKPSETGKIPNFCICAPLQHKKNIIQGAIHHLFRATSNLEAFHEEFTKMKKFVIVINILGVG